PATDQQHQRRGRNHDQRCLELRLVRGRLVRLRRSPRGPEPSRVPTARPPSVLRVYGRPEPNSTRRGGENASTGVPRLHRACWVPPPATANPGVVPDPATVIATIANSSSSGCKLAAGSPGGGHTHWSNGNTFYDGFTTALPPNTLSLSGTPALDSDLVSEDE